MHARTTGDGAEAQTLDGIEIVGKARARLDEPLHQQHYAHLCALAGGVDAFLIGSEMRGLTTIRDGAASYPAVPAFRALAADVRAILGPGAAISYAADWSEYFGHHSADGSGDVFFHLDPLWAEGRPSVAGMMRRAAALPRVNLGYAESCAACVSSLAEELSGKRALGGRVPSRG